MQINNILKQLTVLYLEDDDLVRNNITTSISYVVNKVYSVSNAEEALDVYHEKKPDIIITDIDMKGMNGLDFIKEIRTKDNFIPVIIITAYKTENFLMEALTLYIDKYIIKPVTLDILVDSLEICTKRIIELNRFQINFTNGSSYDITKELFTLSSGKIEKLAHKEQLLFNLLLENKNTLTLYFMIEQYVWSGDEISKGSLKLIITKLRGFLGKDSIINEPQMGYKLVI